MQREDSHTWDLVVLPSITGIWNLKLGHLYIVQNTKCFDFIDGRQN